MSGAKEKLLDNEAKDEDDDDDESSSSSSSSSEDEEGLRESGTGSESLPLRASVASEAGAGGPKLALARWKKAGAAVRAQVLVRKIFSAMGTEERKRYVMRLFMISVVLNILDTESKAVAFHTTAVGKYSVDGKPYKFSYSLFIALLVFIIKLLLGPLKKLLGAKGGHHGQGHGQSGSPKRKPDGTPKHVKSEEEKEHKKLLKEKRKQGFWVYARAMMIHHGSSVKAMIMPWFLLFAFTLCEMISVTMANYALNETPTSIFIVLRCSKMGIVAVVSRLLLGSKLRKPQWVALLLMVIALLIATIAENKGGKKGGGLSWQGPVILIISECFYSFMLILQQIAVTEYWPDPMLLVSASSILGIPMTLLSMKAASHIRSPQPPHHPVSDWTDVFCMMSNSTVLTMAILGHLTFRISLDAFHIVSAKHLPALERAMTDVVKLGMMWILGKAFWFTGAFILGDDWPQGGGVFATLAEPWHPLSFLMIPGLILISYAMLMYKFKVYAPVILQKDKTGKWGLAFQEAPPEEGDVGVNTGLDDPFYSEVFTNRKTRHTARAALDSILTDMRAKRNTVFKTGEAKNKWQFAALKGLQKKNTDAEDAANSKAEQGNGDAPNEPPKPLSESAHNIINTTKTSQ